MFPGPGRPGGPPAPGPGGLVPAGPTDGRDTQVGRRLAVGFAGVFVFSGVALVLLYAIGMGGLLWALALNTVVAVALLVPPRTRAYGAVILIVPLLALPLYPIIGAGACLSLLNHLNG